jgi:predicted amidohydrolase
MRVMAVSPINKRSGKVELSRYCKLAEQSKCDIIVFPSSFLPYYKNSTAFYEQQNIETLPGKVPDNLMVIVGVNEKAGEKLYKTTVSFTSTGIKHIHRKMNLEQHYIDKGFSSGSGEDFQFYYDTLGIKINPLECFETLFSENWKGADLVTGSVGFGMLAKTDNYDCDYFDQWLNVIKTHCLLHNCYAVLSCNAQYRDIMTVAVNKSGEVVAMARDHGYFVVDLDKDDFQRHKTPYLQQ